MYVCSCVHVLKYCSGLSECNASDGLVCADAQNGLFLFPSHKKLRKIYVCIRNGKLNGHIR